MHRPAEHVSFQQRFSASDDVAAVLAARPNQILKVDTTDCTLGALLEILMLRRGADRALKVSDSSLRGRLIRGLLKSSKDSRSEGGVGVLRLHASGCNEADANDFAEAFHALLVTASVAKPAARRLSGALHELLNNVHEHAGDDVEGLGAFEVLDREAWMVVADSGRGVLGGYLESPLPKKPVGPEEALKWAVVDHRSRTIKLRVVLSNADGALKPGMFATVEVAGTKGAPHEGVYVPANAIQRDGQQSLVFVRRGPREFEPRVVEIGQVARDWIEVTHGLSEGEEVATAGTFALKSELKKGDLGEDE